jgi:hypothetical protein
MVAPKRNPFANEGQNQWSSRSDAKHQGTQCQMFNKMQ